MNGIHDMGGMHGFGAVLPDADQAPFHARWEGRVFAMELMMGVHLGANRDRFRFTIEQIPAADYLRMSYFERWFEALLHGCREAELLEEAELRQIRTGEVPPGDARPRPFAADYPLVRLYHVTTGRYRNHPLFDRVETLDPPRQLQAPIWHYPFPDWHALVEKENAYSTYQAKTARPRARWMLLARLSVEFPLVFLKSFFLRGHVLGGWKGFVFSMNIAFARFMRVAKMLEAAS